MLNKIKTIFTTNKNYLLLVVLFLYALSIVTQKYEDRKYTRTQVQQSVEQYINNQEIDFEQLTVSPLFIKNAFDSNTFNTTILNKPYGVFIFKMVNNNLQLLSWNNHNYYFNLSDIVLKDTSYLINYNSGYFEFICKNFYKKKDSFLAVAMLPIKCSFSAKNTNTTLFTGFENLHKYYEIDTKNTQLPIKSIGNTTLFYIKKTQSGFFFSYSYTTIFVRCIAILLLLFYINYFSKIIFAKYGFGKAFSVLLCSIFIVRLCTYLFKFPFVFSKLSLFDPSIYASNFLHPSLGDLLINQLLLYWVVSFYSHHKHTINYSKKISTNKLAPIFLLSSIVLITFLFSNALKSLVIDSKIPFDVSNFFGLNIYTAIALLVISSLIINYYKISKYLYKLTIAYNLSFGVQILIIATVCCMFLFSKILAINLNDFFILSVIAWILLFVTLLYLHLKQRPYGIEKKSALTLFWILFFTTSVAATLVYFEKKLEIEQRKKIAERIYLQQNNKLNNISLINSNFEYPYAIYKQQKLEQQFGNYIFLKNIIATSTEFAEFEANSINTLIYNAPNNTTIVLVKSSRDFLNFITLFAYLFFTLVIVVFILYAIENIAFYQFTYKQFIKEIYFGIRIQIIATTVIITVGSFIAIGFVSIYSYIEKFNISNQDDNVKALSLAAEQIKLFNNLEDIASKIQIQKIANQLNVNLNVYNANGNLAASTQPYFYDNQFLNTQINYNAYQSIYIKKELLNKQKENIEEEVFTSFYKPLLNEKEEVIGCVSLPDINYESSLKKELSSFIANLINLNAFIFLIAGAIAFFITNRITASFKLIKNKMKAINWQTQNQEIEWNNDDEIGALVKEYNTMVKKLDATAKAFALSQKEIAWKEMAMQVAHEIKNPLTPMKLSIQYLQNKIDDDAPNIKQLSKTVATTLIEQINQLSNIASDFSQFANIGNDKPENFNINDTVLSLINLYETDEKIAIQHNLLDNKNSVFADKIQLTRLFTNLIKNAVEASITKEISSVIIEQKQADNKVIISVQDNGVGIPIEIQSKIFTLNFTTKSSGTGLGLAICKGIVENAQGKIWFNSNENGTVFFVELPLV